MQAQETPSLLDLKDLGLTSVLAECCSDLIAEHQQALRRCSLQRSLCEEGQTGATAQ